MKRLALILILILTIGCAHNGKQMNTPSPYTPYTYDERAREAMRMAEDVGGTVDSYPSVTPQRTDELLLIRNPGASWSLKNGTIDTLLDLAIVTPGADPDVSTAGVLGPDTDDHWLRGYDGTNQFVYGSKSKRIHFAFQNPNSIMTHAGRSTRSQVIFCNDTGSTLTITKVFGQSDTDDYAFKLFISDSATDIGTANDSEVYTAIFNCTVNGTSCYTVTVTSGFDDATIANGQCLIFEHSSGTAGSFYGYATVWQDGDVN